MMPKRAGIVMVPADEFKKKKEALKPKTPTYENGFWCVEHRHWTYPSECKSDCRSAAGNIPGRKSDDMPTHLL